MVREEQGNHNKNSQNSISKNILVVQGAGNVRSREESNAEEEDMEPVAKKPIQQTMTLVDGHSEKGLQPTTQITCNEGEIVQDSIKESGLATQGLNGGRAATGPGATGKLSGATESAQQEP